MRLLKYLTMWCMVGGLFSGTAWGRGEEGPCLVPPEHEACAPACVVKQSCLGVDKQKIQHICYDCKTYDYCYTHGAKWPIIADLCPCLFKCKKPCVEHCEKQPKCGKPRTRRVLIKHFVEEEVCRPSCEVHTQMVCPGQ